MGDCGYTVKKLSKDDLLPTGEAELPRRAVIRPIPVPRVGEAMGSLASGKEQAGGSEELAELGEETQRKKLSHSPHTASQKQWPKS